MGANVNIVFSSGVGHLNASLIRDGVVVASGSTDVSGAIPFPDAQSDDVISIDGVCTGTADLTIDVSTSPATPVNYQAGNFFGNFIVL